MSYRDSPYGLVLVLVVALLLFYWYISKYGSKGDTNSPAGQAAPFTLLNPEYDPFKTSPARSSFIPGIIGDAQMWLTSVTTDTGLRW